MYIYFIPLVLFLVYTIGSALIAFFRPVKKNILKLLSTVISFGISAVLGATGCFSFLGNIVFNLISNTEEVEKITRLSEAFGLTIKGLLSALGTCFAFPLVFFILCLIFNIVLMACRYFPNFMNIGYYAKSMPVKESICEASDKTFITDNSEKTQQLEAAQEDRLQGAQSDDNISVDEANAPIAEPLQLSVNNTSENSQNATQAPVTQNRESIYLRLASVAIGLIMGIILSAVLMTPLFYIDSFVQPAFSSACDNIAIDNINTREALIKFNEELSKPYSSLFSTKVYKYTGMSGLICKVIDSSSNVSIGIEKLCVAEETKSSLYDLLSIYFNISATHESNKRISSNFDSLKNNKLFTKILSEAAFNAMEDAVISIPTYQEGESQPFEYYFVSFIKDAFNNSDEEHIREQIVIILDFCRILSENEFFNDLYISIQEEENDQIAVTAVLVKNIRLVGAMMDALYECDHNNIFADMILNLIITSENVTEYFPTDIIQQLDSEVRSGKTTYQSFCITLENIINLVDINKE